MWTAIEILIWAVTNWPALLSALWVGLWIGVVIAWFVTIYQCKDAGKGWPLRY